MLLLLRRHLLSRLLAPFVQFFRLPPTFPCSAPQLQAIINTCMSLSDPVSPGKKYLQNATLHFLPEASWAVLRPIAQRNAAAASISPSPAASSPLAASSMASPLTMSSALEMQQAAAGFTSPRQPPPLPLPLPLPLLLYVEIQPLHRPSTIEVTQTFCANLQNHTCCNIHPARAHPPAGCEPRIRGVLQRPRAGCRRLRRG